MAKQKIMKIKPCPFVFVVSLLFFKSLAVPNGTPGTMSTNLTNYSNEERTAKDFKNTKKISEQPNSVSDYDERSKRSVELLINDTISNITSANITDSAFDLSYFSERFLNCSAHIEVEPESFELLSNESVFIPLYKMTLNRSDYIINKDVLYICPDFFEDMQNELTFTVNLSVISLVRIEKVLNETFFIPLHVRTFKASSYYRKNKDVSVICPYLSECIDPEYSENFTRNLSFISIFGSFISAVCLILHIILNFCIKIAKNLPSYCLLSLCVAFLLGYSFTFIQHAAEDDTFCMVVGMLMVYSFLASFFWMNVFSYDVWRSFHLATTKLRSTGDGPVLVRFASYSLYAWGSPLLIVIASIVVHNVTASVKYQLIFDKSTFSLKHTQALTLYFAGPAFTLLGTSILLMVSSFLMISTATTKSRINTDSFGLRARLYLSLRLGSSMGLTWIFGILAIVTKQEWMWYSFALCRPLQGVLIFCSFLARSRKECRKALKGGSAKICLRMC